MSKGYLQEVRGDLDGPSCRVCGAIMVKACCECLEAESHISHKNGRAFHVFTFTGHRKCLSCGTTTGCTDPAKEEP